MKLTCGLTLTLPLLLVLLLAVATKGHTVLQCYVCDNCEKVNKKLTPLEQCGGENFSMSTTTPGSTSMSPSSESTTTSPSESLSTTTAMPHRDTTARPSSTEDPETTNTTIELITLSTNSLPSSTTPSTTTVDSTNNGTSGTTTPAVFVTPTEESSTTTSTTTTTTTTTESDLVIPSGNITWAFPAPGNLTEGGLNRQRRHTEFNGITYYCYKIQKRYDNVFGTKRGCIGVKTNERPVCDELDMANNNQTKKCSACTTTMCNGSSTLGVSIATLLVALVALIYKV